MVRTVIVGVNSKYIHSSLAPWCLFAAVPDRSELFVAEGTINEDPQRLVERILALQPELAAFSCYIWNRLYLMTVIKMLREENPKIRILLGGPEVSYCVEESMRQTGADYLIAGEGEEPFARFLEQYPDPTGILGLSYRDGEKIVVREPYLTQNIPKSPYTPEYFAALKGRIAYLETSRGCPFSCAFCLSGRCGKPRFYPMERAKEELLLLANSGTRTVKLVDRTFNANPQRAYELWSFLREHLDEIPPEVCFHFEVGGDLLDEKSLKLLEDFPAGRIQLEIGLQSFSERTLRAVCRKTDNERLKRNIRRLTAKGNLHVHIDLIAGLPYEDYKTFGESFNTAFSLHPQMLQLGFLKLIYGSAMREEPEKYPCTYSDKPPYEVEKTPYMTAEELKRIHGIEDWLERTVNSGRFLKTMAYLIAQTGRLPFSVFEELAEKVGVVPAGTSLTRFAEILYDGAQKTFDVEKDALRDAMVCDLLATDASGRLPLILEPQDSRIFGLRRQLDAEPQTRRPDGVRRGMAILHQKPWAVYVDYTKPHPVSGRYPLRVLTSLPKDDKIL